MHRDDEYLETRVMTARPWQLHMMVVDGAVRNARLALEALERNDLEAAHFALNDARSFVSELTSGLDATHSPEIVENLKALFTFAYRNLVHADVERNPQCVRNALRVLELHRETWIAVVEATSTSSTQPSPRPPVEDHLPTEAARHDWST